MQLSHFSTGGFVVHRLYISDSVCKFSAWFDAAGKFLDADRINAAGHSLPVSEKQKAKIAPQGVLFASHGHMMVES